MVMVMHVCPLCSWEMEVGGLSVQGLPELHIEMLLKEKKKEGKKGEREK